MKIHRLKTVNPYFEDMWNGLKKFDIRTNNTKFEVGDNIYFHEYDVDIGYKPRSILVKIIYIMDDPEYVKMGHVILGTETISHEDVSYPIKKWEEDNEHNN